MNFILTYDCDKGCRYCFAKKSREEIQANRHMTIEDYEMLIDKSGVDFVKMLGGEPTSHPEFMKLLDIAFAKKPKVILITNMLFKDEILEHIVKKIRSGNQISFLVNTTDIDLEDRVERWSKNYKAIFSELYKIDREEHISCGITLEKDKNEEYYDSYLNYIVDNVIKIERLRISLPFPSGDGKNPMEIIQEKSWGRKLIFVINKCLSLGIKPTIDEILYPCVFENKEQAKYVRKFAEGGEKYKCNGSPFDIFPDKKVSYCYPLKDKVVVDSEDFDDLNQANNAMLAQYRITLEDHRNKIPEVCNNCAFFQKTCEGPCLGLLY